MLILSARTTRDYAGAVATANQLSFLEVQSMLAQPAAVNLATLEASLDRDYRVLNYLLKHGADPSSAGDMIETRMLSIYYSLLRSSYRMTRNFAPSAALRAVSEMASVVAHFANTMGAQAAGAAA